MKKVRVQYSKYSKKRRYWQVVLCFIGIAIVFGGVYILYGDVLLVDCSRKNGVNSDSIAVDVDFFATDENDSESDFIQKDNETEGLGYSISTSSPYATEAGVQVLENGGNAVDAAIAVAYTLAVTEPYGSGLGGGGGMLIYDPDADDFCFYNYAAEAAQSGASSLTLVPGFVSGMETVRLDYGTMEYADLISYAIECCDGVEVNSAFAKRINANSSALGTDSVFYKDGHWLEEGDILVQPELKKTLELLAVEGANSFYSGSVAEMLVNATAFTREDLTAYETIRMDAVVGEYESYTVASAAAPFSGVTLIQMLKMAELLDIPSPSENNVVFLESLQRITIASHADRVKNVYDHRFANNKIDQNAQVTDAYVSSLLDMNIQSYEDDEECEDTTGFTIVDKDGMVVSCTNTLSYFFGCKSQVGGFYLNNSGVNFGTGVNAYAVGKRPRTYISPTIVKGENNIYAIATPGGDAIVKVLANIIMDTSTFGTEPQEALDKLRMYFMGNGIIWYERGFDTPLIAEVSGYGYAAVANTNHTLFGNVAIAGYSSSEGYYAAADLRRGGESKALSE